MASTRAYPIALAATLAAACGSDAPKANHNLRIDNARAAGACAERTFGYAQATPLDGGDAVVQSFSAPPGQITDVGLVIPRTGAYAVRISLQQGGPAVWWDSITLGESGTTPVVLDAGSDDGAGHGFADSSASGVAATGSDVLCN